MDHDSEERGKLDLTSILYIVCGIPLMATFFVVLFLITRACDIPA